MALDVDQEILQDFLIEAAEILELLSEELVELENDPENAGPDRSGIPDCSVELMTGPSYLPGRYHS